MKMMATFLSMALPLTKKLNSLMVIELFLAIIICMFYTIHRCVNTLLHNDTIITVSKDASKQIRAGTLKEAELETRITYNDAQEEIALKNGGLVTMSKDTNATPGEMILREDLLKLMPIVNGANRMATELQKGVDYELVLAPPGLKVSKI